MLLLSFLPVFLSELETETNLLSAATERRMTPARRNSPASRVASHVSLSFAVSFLEINIDWLSRQRNNEIH